MASEIWICLISADSATERILVLKKLVAILGLIPGAILLILGGYNAALTLLAQIFSDFVDFTNFSIVYWLTPYTSPGGSGTFLDSIVAGPGSSGGSAIRYWTYIAYALMAGIGYATVKTCWGILNEKKSRND